MRRLASHVRRDPEFEENARHHRGLAAELRARLEATREGGPPRARERHTARGRLLVR
ncbi:MAG: methylcrotonoyl-CoA carboxylase, partial [Deltaproteobacteria bacterium]